MTDQASPLPLSVADLLGEARQDGRLARHATLIEQQLAMMAQNLRGQADEFPTVLPAAPLDADVQRMTEVRQVLFALKESVDEALASSYAELEKAKSKRDEAKGAADDGKGVDWAWLLVGEDEGSRVRYKLLDKALAERGLMTSGVFVDTRQRAIKVMLSRGVDGESNLAQTLAGLAEVLPFVKLRPDGYRWLAVAEHTLSINGSYYCKLDQAGGRFALVRNGHRETEVHVAPSLRGLLEYILEHHWYEDASRDGHEPDDHDED